MQLPTPLDIHQIFFFSNSNGKMLGHDDRPKVNEMTWNETSNVILTCSPWNLKRMNSALHFNQVPSRRRVQRHVVLVPKVHQTRRFSSTRDSTRSARVWEKDDPTAGRYLWFHQPSDDGQGEAVDGAEEFDRGVFKHGVGPKSGQEVWPPDHRPFVHIFFSRLHLHLNRERGESLILNKGCKQHVCIKYTCIYIKLCSASIKLWMHEERTNCSHHFLDSAVRALILHRRGAGRAKIQKDWLNSKN